MNSHYNRIVRLVAIGASCSLAAWISTANAKDDETSVLVKKPAAATEQGPELPPPAKPTKAVTPQQQQLPAKSGAKQPFMRPAPPREPAQSKLTAQSEPMPAPAGPQSSTKPTSEPNVHPAPPIKYDTHHDVRRMYRSGQVELVMVTQDPADGCCYEIPLCIPACCTGDPTIKSGHGLLGRGVVEYCWSCGFRAKVKFRHVLGDVKVDYEGS